MIQPQKHVKISELFAQVKKEPENQEKLSIIKDPHSIELFPILWHKAVISQIKTERIIKFFKFLVEVKVFMAPNLKMKTFLENIPNQDCFQWQTLDQTPTDRNSLSLTFVKFIFV